jgi:2TM domain
MSDEELRQQALRSIKAKRDFRTHVFVYVAVNLFLVGVWAFTGARFFWPIFPMLGWGIGLSIHAWEAYRGDRVTEDQIQREMRRLRGSSQFPPSGPEDRA